MGFGFSISYTVNAALGVIDHARKRWRRGGGFGFGGVFGAELLDANGERLWKTTFPNGVTDAGINDNESVCFDGGTQKPNWYFGLINNSGFSALAASDTMSSHAGWTESTDYSEGVRQEWAPSAPASRVITNSTPAAFSINTTVTIKGAFLVSNSTKGGTSGILWSTGLFSVAQSLINGQTLRLTYTLTGTSS